MRSLFNLIFSKPIFSRVLLALFISGIGTAFTSVAVYQQLAERDFGPFGFAIAFVAGLLPGMITSYFAGRYYKRWALGKTLLLGQLVGLLMLIFPLVAGSGGSIVWLLLAEIAASAVGGLLIPVYKTIERSSFLEEDLPKLAVLDTFWLTANFICGQGLGAILASVLTLRQFLLVDVFSYILALIILWPLGSQIKETVKDAESFSDRESYRKLDSRQKQAVWLLPWLAFTCAPLMILFPAKGADFSEVHFFGSVMMVPALFLICFRTLGQLIGPMVAAKLDIQKLSEKKFVLVWALLSYIFLYTCAFKVSSIYAAAVLCLMAHILSNIVYAVGNYQLMKFFKPEEVGWAFTFVYRISTLLIGITAIASGVLAESFGLNLAIGISLVGWIFGTLFFLKNQQGVIRA